MKILLLGEYSNVHWTLAEGLREIGHNVTVVSDGDVWKNYKRDITLKRQFDKPFSALRYLKDVVKLLPKLRGFLLNSPPLYCWGLCQKMRSLLGMEPCKRDGHHQFSGRFSY